MIETPSDMAVFLLICLAVFLVLAIVGGKAVEKALEKVGQSLRGWLG